MSCVTDSTAPLLDDEVAGSDIEENQQSSPSGTDSDNDPYNGEASAAEGQSFLLDLPGAALQALRDIAERMDYTAGETIAAAGQFDPNEAMIIAKGTVQVTYIDLSRNVMISDQLTSGRYLGVAEAISGQTMSRAQNMTIDAVSDCEVHLFEAQALRELVIQRPSLMKGFLLGFADQLANAPLSVEKEQSSPERRIYLALINRVERVPGDRNWKIRQLPKHREIAMQTDTSENLVATTIADLIQKGLACRDYPDLVIRDIDALRAMVN